MKQTNNALKYLLAQYRAIFKNAYVKGLASAVLVTAGLGLAAGQAQAAVSPWYHYASTSSTWKGHTQASGSSWTSKANVAGAVDTGTSGSDNSGSIVASAGDGIASGGNLTIGANGATRPNDTSEPQITQVTGSAYGGYAVISSGAMTAIARNNVVSLISGGNVTGGHLVGGWAKQTADGVAEATQNVVNIFGDETQSTTLSVGTTEGHQVIGAWASSKHGATATENNVIISGGSSTDISKMNFGVSGGIFGAQVWADNGAIEGNYTAQSNGVSIKNTTLTANNTQTIAGGHIFANEDKPGDPGSEHVKVSTFNASNNTISLDNVGLANNTKSTLIAGNFIEHNFKNAQSQAERFIANGDGSTPNLDIKNSSLTKVTAYGAHISVGKVAGASGSVKGMGDITATNNVITLTNTDLAQSAVYGAGIVASASQAQGLTVTGNSVKVSVEEATSVNNFKGTEIYGAKIQNNFSHLDGDGAAKAAAAKASQITASNNTVTIGANNTFDFYDQAGDGWTDGILGSAPDYTVTPGVDLASNVYGVQIHSEEAGVKITADNNSVSFDGRMVGNIKSDRTLDKVITAEKSRSGLIVGVHNASANGGSITNTKVSIGSNAKVTDGAIAAVYDAAADEANTSTYNNNTVEIANGAELTRTDVYAVFYSDTATVSGSPTVVGQTATLNSKVTTAGTHVDSSLYGGAGSGSVVSLENNSLFKVSAGVNDVVISSDVIDLAGQVEVGNGGTLTIKGFARNGNQADTVVNSNQTDIASSARIFNKGTIELFGQTTVANGATLSAMTTGALLKVNGDETKIDTTPDKGDIFTDFVGGTGELIISSESLKSYLTSGDKYTIDDTTGEQEDYAGTVQITSGGILHFTDASIDISKFDYSTTAEAGKIQVDSTTNGTSIIKGDDVTVSHKFASNGSADVKYEALQDIKSQGISIEANSLTLGSSALSSTQSENLTFYKATVRDEINFVAMGSGLDVGEDGKTITTPTNQYNDGYHLTSQVIGSHYMLTNSQDGKLQYYTAQDGVINGPVTLTSNTSTTGDTDSGEIWIQNGHWTANGQITLASGGNLTVGGDDDIDHKASGIPEGPDATLVLNQALVLDVSSSGGDSTVRVTGSGGRFDVVDYAEHLDGTVSAVTDRVALLDLRNGLTMQGNGVTNNTYDHKATFDVTDKGIVLLDADDLNTILSQNDTVTNQTSSGAFFKASNGGAYIVNGDVNADFGDFSSDAANYQNGFNLSGTGSLIANKLTVANDNVESGEHNDADYIKNNAPAVHFGGTVRVADLEINDLQLTTGEGKTSNYASQVVVADGTAHISKSLTSYNSTLILGTDSSRADFFFHTDAFKDTGTIDVDTLRVDSGSIVVTNGEWTADALNLSGAGTSLIVGEENSTYGSDEDINGDDTYATLTATSLTMAQDSYARVYADGKATIGSVDFSKLSSASTSDAASVVVDGTLKVNDSAKFGGEGSILINKNGILAFSGAATNANIIKDGDYTTGNVALVSGSGSFTKVRNDGGELHLDLASSTVFGGDQIRTLKTLLFTADSFTGSTLEDRVLKNGGVLNIGNATFKGVKVEELVGDGLSGYKATWASLKGFSDIFGEDVTNDTLIQTNVYDIKPGDNIQGHWGSLAMESGVAPSAQVEIAGNTSLNFATGNNGYFISTADHQSALGANIQAKKDLTLENGGIIGKITMEPGTSDAEKNWTVLNVVGANKTTIDSIIGESDSTGNDAPATLVSIQGGETEVSNTIQYIRKVEALNGAYLHVLGDADFGSLNTLNSDAKFDKTLTVDEGVIVGGTTEAKDIVFNGDGKVLDAIDTDDFDSVDILNGGLLKAETFTFKLDPINGGNGALIVGYDLDEAEATLEDGTRVNGTGYLEISNYLDLNGGTLIVDPAYGEATSVAAVMNFKDGTDTTYETQLNDVGIVDGSALIGKNAALGIGATLEETREAIAAYQTNGSLSEDDYGSILYLNGQLTLTANAEIALNSASTVNTVEGIRNALKYNVNQETNDDLRKDQYADLGLGLNTAILMTEQAFISDDKGTKNGVAITFDQTNAVVNGQGGDIVLIGTFDAKDPLNFFKDGDAEGQQGVKIIGGIDVYTQNGFLYTRLEGDNAGYNEKLKVDTDRAYAVMYEASDPVVDTLISYHVDRGGAVAGEESTQGSSSSSSTLGGSETVPAAVIETQQPTVTAQNNTNGPDVTIGSGSSSDNSESTTPPTSGTDGNNNAGGGADPDIGTGGNNGSAGDPQPEQPNNPTTSTRVTGSSDFLNEVVTNSHGAPAEAAARLAIYGGTVQAALGASSTTTDAIAARLGVGNAAGLTIANNGQGAALWVAPVYKSHDSDGFDSQGLDYGVDLNLYGVALGADLEIIPGFTAGLMFNVGSGDVDGKGNTAANNTSNDFDYWGAALYGSYRYDALTVAADIGYTVVDNDLEATTGMDKYSKLESSADSTALTFGVTAKYAFDFNTVEVAPHAGLRYTNVDLDDYTVTANGEDVAHFDAGSISVFSIPVGVTVAKEFQGDNWSVKPMFDLTLTGNFGDDEVDGTVSWTGVDNLTTGVSSEFLDNFTYGATLGVEAKTGSFSFGLGVNYTGSSNADEYGVNANARFVF